MPVHDWTRADSGLFHDFHQSWACALSDALNRGGLPPGYFALLAAPPAAPRSLSIERNEAELYADRADRITVSKRYGEVASVIEIVSPGNKAGQAEFLAFVRKSADLIFQGVHLLVIDLFPPGKRDPLGIHKAIWDQFVEEDFELLSEKPLTLASFDAGPGRVAYVESAAVGDLLPEMPIFLRPEFSVPAPLEATYRAAWDVFPAPLKRLLETPRPAPGSEGEKNGA